MDITYLGHSSFLIRGRSAKVVVDPFSSKVLNKKFPSVDADIVTVSHHHDDHDAVNEVSGDFITLDMPGEYEIKGVRVYGFETYHDKNKGEDRGKNTMFKFEIDDMTLLHCGDLGHALTAETLDQIGGADVVLVPVGGVYTIDADEARSVVEKLEPSIVIPMHYRDPQLSPSIEKYGEMAELTNFLEKIGVTDVEPTKKFSVKQSDIIEGDMQVVVMETK